jgi:hypothetical protein
LSSLRHKLIQDGCYLDVWAHSRRW